MPIIHQRGRGIFLLSLAAIFFLVGAQAAPSAGTNNPTRKAYVTLLVENNGFMAGATALGKSLQASRSRVSRVALVTPNVNATTRKYIKAGGWTVRDVKPITCAATKTSSLMQETGLRTVPESFPSHCTKFHVFNMVDFDKIVFLDADTLVERNIDDLFALDAAFAAAPDFANPFVANTGVMVLVPDASKFEALVRMAGEGISYNGGDQAVLNAFFATPEGGGRNWYERSADDPLVARLNPAFNFQIGPLINHYMADMHGSLDTPFELMEPRVIHFVGVSNPKPWVSVGLALQNRTKEEAESKAPPRIPDGVHNLSPATWGMHLRWFHYMSLPPLGFDWQTIPLSAPPAKSSKEVILERYQQLAAKAAEVKAGGGKGAKGGENKAKDSDFSGVERQEATEETGWEDDDEFEHDEL